MDIRFRRHHGGEIAIECCAVNRAAYPRLDRDREEEQPKSRGRLWRLQSRQLKQDEPAVALHPKLGSRAIAKTHNQPVGGRLRGLGWIVRAAGFQGKGRLCGRRPARAIGEFEPGFGPRLEREPRGSEIERLGGGEQSTAAGAKNNQPPKSAGQIHISLKNTRLKGWHRTAVGQG